MKQLLFILALVLLVSAVPACVAEDAEASGDSASALASARYQAAGTFMDETLFSARYATNRDDPDMAGRMGGDPKAESLDAAKPTPTIGVVSEPDLVLTGVFAAGSLRCANFELVDGGTVRSRFMLESGQHNEWLEVRSVEAGKVKVVLKRPMMRIRNTGIEVMLSFENHRARQ